MPGKIAFVTYETPFAPSGGIAAVVGRLPGYVFKASGLQTFVITPFHYRIDKTASQKGQMARAGRITVPFDGDQIPINLLRLERQGSWCFLEVEDERFFAGERHPYDVASRAEGMTSTLLRDALFFGRAAARALPLLEPKETWTVMAQDWEAATTALAVAQETGLRADTFLTIHNSYDSGATDADLLRFDLNPLLCPGKTVLERALTLVQEPVFTVSDQFALDFAEEILQSTVLAPHLKTVLSDKLLGVNNGMFTDLSIDPEILAQAQHGEVKPLQEWKQANRIQALKALDGFAPTKDQPVWGNLRKFKRDQAPWFVMAGRDDPRQKGYDVACQAINDFLAHGGRARFFFSPIPGDEGLPGLGFLRKLSQRFPESVLVLPFRLQEGYLALLQGASYGIMPSLYEPFGMANEFYLKGTVGLGRATGGIIQQIVPLRAAACFGHAVQRRSDRYYGASAKPTGFLYRERDGIATAVADWMTINAAGYDPAGRSPDRVEQRSALPMFQAMASELRTAIEDAVRVYEEQPELYFEMLVEGIGYIQRTFSWERAAQAYVRHI
ncbi:MAG TPA: glycogen/starch synthase [Anaerolineales bacterium]|nr:glycogen/starch synthase [Anaerolineales bacterium]